MSCKIIYQNLGNFLWFRLSRYYNRYFTSYVVNPTVYNIYEYQREWDESIRHELRSIAVDLYNDEGFTSFKQLASDLQNPEIEFNSVLVVLYIAVQYGKLYIDRGEAFSIKHLITELEYNMAIGLEKQETNKSQKSFS